MVVQRRKKIVVIFLVFLALVSLIILSSFSWFVIHYATNITRPIWDIKLREEQSRWKFVPFLGFNRDNLSMTCGLHNWSKRNQNIRVYDAFLFSSEVDIVEIRMNELDSVVDLFIVVEENCAFMGIRKPYLFDRLLNRSEIAKFAHKIKYVQRDIEDCSKHPKSFTAESMARDSLFSTARQSGARNGDLFIMSDVDEIPRRDVVKLLKECDFGSRIHFAMDIYLYSFEYRQYPEFTYRAHASVIGTVSDYEITARFRYLTDKIIGDGGWHCSWCIRSIESMILKMKWYSHADRLDHDPTLAEIGNFQERICRGEDPFGYLPEATSFQALVSQWSLRSIQGSSHAPIWVQRNPSRFRYLLSGGCLLR